MCHLQKCAFLSPLSMYHVCEPHRFQLGRTQLPYQACVRRDGDPVLVQVDCSQCTEVDLAEAFKLNAKDHYLPLNVMSKLWIDHRWSQKCIIEFWSDHKYNRWIIAYVFCHCGNYLSDLPGQVTCSYFDRSKRQL